MPASVFTDLERDRLNGFPAHITVEECSTYGTLTLDDLTAIAELRGDHNRLGYAVQVASLRYLGFVPDVIDTAPAAFVDYLAHQLALDPAVLAMYGQRPQTRTDHLQQIVRRIKWRMPTKQHFAALHQWLVERALEHDRPVVLFGLAAERLKSTHLVRPHVTVVERLVMTAREAAQRETFQRLEKHLKPKLRKLLDQLLIVDPELHVTRLAWLRQKAVANTPEEILTTLKKIEYLQRLGVPKWNLQCLPPNRLHLLAELGKRTTNQALARMPSERRYPALVAFLHGILAEQTDLAVELVAACLHSTQGRAERELEIFRKSHAKTTNQLVHYFAIMGRLTLDEAVPDSKLRKEILRAIPRDELSAALEEQQRIGRPLDDNALDFLASRFAYVHRFVPHYLDTLRFHAHPEADPLLEAVKLLRQKRWPKRQLAENTPLQFVTPTWRPYVIAATGQVRRSAYELSTVQTLCEALKSGNVWVEHSRQYSEPASYLMPTATWKDQRQDICDLLQTATDGRLQLHLRQADLESLLERLDATLPTDLVRVEDDELVVSPLPEEAVPARIEQVIDLIDAAMPLVDLAELLIEVDDEVHFTEALTHAGGGTPHLPALDLKRYLYAAILAQACNYGVTRMAQMADLSYDTLVWVTEWYLREETLKAANALIVNAHHRLSFSRHWGSGEFSSSDGQRFPIMGKARNARTFPRYFATKRKGITYYTWTSDQLSQYGTKVTIVTLRDATYVLDEILDNVTELPIEEHTVDTAGYTELVFCFFDLLGLRFSPRIKDLASQWIYRMDRQQRYAALEPVLKGTINQRLILTHYEELLHIVGSLKYGYASASLLISKLQASVKQNALARAGREYGRLIKSIFLLRMLTDEQERRYVQRQLNKGENIHALRKFLRCANEGLIRQHQPEEQLNQAICLTLLTNATIFWNTQYLDLAVRWLRKRGYAIRDEDIAHIYPTHYAHINPHGKLTFPIRAHPTLPLPRRPSREPRELRESRNSRELPGL